MRRTEGPSLLQPSAWTILHVGGDFLDRLLFSKKGKTSEATQVSRSSFQRRRNKHDSGQIIRSYLHKKRRHSKTNNS